MSLGSFYFERIVFMYLISILARLFCILGMAYAYFFERDVQMTTLLLCLVIWIKQNEKDWM